MPQPHVLAIHDISGVGRCSLTVALPVLSAAGIECSVLPTAVLSTHTGDFEGYTYRSLSNDLLPMARHWVSLGLEFDAIYTGYLASLEQVELIKQIIALLRSDRTLLVVDPVMADKGTLYPGFPDSFPAEMRTLCAQADLIVPNLTEAALLLGRPYEENPSVERVQSLIHALISDIGAKAAVLTGVSLGTGELGAITYDPDGLFGGGEQSYAGAPAIPGMYHGSGDVFSSTLVAALMRGRTLFEANEIAVHFTAEAIRLTAKAGTEPRYGLNFEALLTTFSSQFS